MSGISKPAEKYDLPVIEDAAQAIGSEYPYYVEGGSVISKKAGSMVFLAVFLFPKQEPWWHW